MRVFAPTASRVSELETLRTRSHRACALLRAVPVACLVGVSWVLAWDTGGSIEAAHWLAYAVLAGSCSPSCSSRARPPVPGGCRSSGGAARRRSPLDGDVGGLVSRPLAGARRRPARPLLRRLPADAARHAPRAADRLAAMVVVVLGLGGFSPWTAVWLREAGDPELLYYDGRLDFPVTYWNGQAAMALVAFWPAVALAARSTSTRRSVRSRWAERRPWRVSGWGRRARAEASRWPCPQSSCLPSPAAAAAARADAVVAVLGAFAAEPLTEPFRTDGQAFDDAVRHAGTVTLVLAGIGTLAGLAYALVDQRLRVSGRGADLGAADRLGLVCAAALAAPSASSRPWSIPRPCNAGPLGGVQEPRPRRVSASSHFGALGSNRYDFWPVAWDEFERHPSPASAGTAGGTRTSSRGELRDASSRPLDRARRARGDRASSASSSVIGAGRPRAVRARAHVPRKSLAATGALGRPRTSPVHTGATGSGRSPPSGCRHSSSRASRCRTTGRPLPAASRFLPDRGCARRAPPAFSPPWLSSRFVERPTTRRRTRRPPENSSGPGGSIRCPSTRTSPRRGTPGLAGGCPPLPRAVAKQPRARSCASCSAWRCSTPGRDAAQRRRAPHALGALAARRGDSERPRQTPVRLLAMAVLATAVERDSDAFSRRRRAWRSS